MSEENTDLYGFMDMNIDDAKDMEILPSGSEVQLQIVECYPNPERCSMRLRLSIVGGDIPAGKELRGELSSQVVTRLNSQGKTIQIISKNSSKMNYYINIPL